MPRPGLTIRQVMRTLHLWLGLISGLILLIVCLSGCAYVFEAEIRNSLQEYRHVQPRPSPMLKPSELRAIAERQFPGETASRVVFEGSSRAAFVQFGDWKTPYYKLVFIDPYSGLLLKAMDMNSDPLHILFSLHYRLLLPPEIGVTIVDYATLVFVAVVVTGLINWWPRIRSAIGKRFFIKWRSSWRRRCFDLHNVPGFYAFPILLLIACTGLVWGFEWFNGTVQWIASGGASRPPAVTPVLGKAVTPGSAPRSSVDDAWRRLADRHPDAESMIIFLPSADEPIRCIVNPDRGTYYQTDHYYIDQHSLAEIPVDNSWGMYSDADTAAMVRRMNYDIHIGAIAGIPGKILVFSATLIAASLPVTGFLIWWGKRRR